MILKLYKTLDCKLKTFHLVIFFSAFQILIINIAASQNHLSPSQVQTESDFTLQQVLFDANNISTFIINTGIFNQDLRVPNTPGFQWPIGTGKFAIFTSGLCIGAYYNNELREAMASYKGEYAPGYVVDSAGHPVARTDIRLHIYKVRRTDGYTNPDWMNWGQMVQFGAPFVDVNHNGIYDPLVDTPGVKDAAQTLFVCLTDGFDWRHQIGEGFGGGTLPLYAEVRMTAWAYNSDCLVDVQFLKWVIINRSHTPWSKTYFSICSDCDLGDPADDYDGCDTLLQLGYTYNGEDMDGSGQGVSYGLHPPAVGMTLLEGAVNKHIYPHPNLRMTSCVYFANTSAAGPLCEKDPNGEQYPAYNIMRGIKKDETPWVVPPGGYSNRTKYCYSGDPESGNGWTEGLPGNPSGSVLNCGGPEIDTGRILPVNFMDERRFVISSGAENLTVNPGDTQTIAMAQLIARGTNNLNSVTKLKLLAQCVRDYYNQYIGIKPISSTVPRDFVLYQNYPNPFNPTTKIKFEIAPLLNQGGVAPTQVGDGVVLKIYDILGHEVATLINEQLEPGSYEVAWDASNYSSGIYFYRLQSGTYSVSKKMLLLK